MRARLLEGAGPVEPTIAPRRRFRMIPAMRARTLIFLTVLATAGCRNEGRISDRRPPRPTADSGVVEADASPGAVDAGFVDSGLSWSDAGPPEADAGSPPVDAGPPDSGVTRPDAGPPPGALPVQALQDPTHPQHPAIDSEVRLYEVIVTAVISGGQSDGSFWVQEAGGGPFSGVLVFLPSGVPNPGVQVGDRVTLTGTYTEFFDVTEVVLISLDTAVPGAPPAPMTVPALELANGSPTAEQWEGVLVRVSGVTVLDTMPDAPDDFGEWVVTGGLRVDDMIFALEPRPSVGTSFTAIVGVHHHSFENYKIEPRDAADFVP